MTINYRKKFSLCMKLLKAAISFNSHKMKELKRLYRSEKPSLTITSQNDYKWNKRNLFLSILNL